MYKYFCAVSKGLRVQHCPGSFALTNQISLSAASATDESVSNGGHRAKKSRNNADILVDDLISLGVNIFLLMPARLSEGGNSLNISVTPAVGLSSPGFVRFVEKQEKKCTFLHIEIDSADGP